MTPIHQYSSKDYNVFIGLDVDLKSYVVNVKDHELMNRLIKIPAHPESFGNYVQKNYNGCRVICAYEAGPTGFGLYDHLISRHIPCVLVSPLSIPKASNQRVKTNRIDAEKIAQYLKNGEVKPVRVPEADYRELRQFIRCREEYVSLIKRSKQRIKALLLSQSLATEIKDTQNTWSNRYISQLQQLSCSPAVRQRLNLLLADLAYAREKNLYVLKELKNFCAAQEDIKRSIGYLRSIPGIGFIIATTILANIGNPKYLTDPREFASFAGLVPCESSTGDRVIKGSITHLGNAVLRSLLVEAAWITIRHDKRLSQFYHRIKNKHHADAGAKKAIVAVARKLTMIIYRVLKDQREYVVY